MHPFLSDAKYRNHCTLIAGFDEISRMADRINLSKTTVDLANSLFKQVLNVKGHSAHAKASACLYIACRHKGLPRTFKEICAVSSGTDKKKIGRCFKLMIKALVSTQNTKHCSSTSAVTSALGKLIISETPSYESSAVASALRKLRISEEPTALASTSYETSVVASALEKLAISDVASF